MGLERSASGQLVAEDAQHHEPLRFSARPAVFSWRDPDAHMPCNVVISRAAMLGIADNSVSVARPTPPIVFSR